MHEISCETCGATEGVKFCEGCNDYYCDPHWKARRAHRESRVGPSGIPHSQLDPEIVRQVNELMAEPADDTEEQVQHEMDEDTLWFGLSKDNYGDPILAEYSRFMTVIMETSEGTPARRYPGLVSFVGETGSGKSTLIRLLMNLEIRNAPVTGPVIGRSTVEVPTSADVHLYLDPKSKFDRPILFADCEGFEGGERDPIAQSLAGRNSSNETNISTAAFNSKDRIHKLVNFTKRALRWASRDVMGHESKSKRQYAISEMYPRIFHVFSDAVVFVLNNPKTMEGVVEKLLLWADSNYSASMNLPSKPHAIIVLNKSSSSTPEDQWSRWRATEEFFKSMDPQVFKNKTFERYVMKWAKSNKTITTMQDLFECYYSGVQVLRIPDKSRYQLLHQQGNALHDTIVDCCDASLRRKKDRKMLPDADQFQLYLSIAFDHFSNTLDEPFDYVKASLQHKSPPQSISDNLSEFITFIARTCHIEGQIETLFNKVTSLVASCIMFDSARKQLLGNPPDWFGLQPREPSRASGAAKLSSSQVSYESICKYTINEYYETLVPCGFRIQPGVLEFRGFQCASPYRTHGDMHRQTGIIGHVDSYYGRFEGPKSFDLRSYAWEQRIYLRLLEIYKDYDGRDSREARVKAHSLYVREFYGPLLQLNCFDNCICLVCLFNPAQYTLQCGHIICRQCMLDFGRPGEGSQVVVDFCPLSGNDKPCSGVEGFTYRSSILDIEPAHTGLRILTLDGGGIRGIIELVVLKEIEDRIGIPLQSFFDLVVGTSTGGIVALAFGHCNLPLTECIEIFQGVVHQAFKPRKLQNTKALRHMEQLWKKSKYETRSIDHVLRESFGTSNLFGASQEKEFKSRPSPLRVAVLTTSGSGTKTYLASNYNIRLNPQQSSPGGRKPVALEYTRYRPSNESDEFQVWQAARATSSAPGYFKPFNHAGLDFLDGALLHNNPIQVAMEEARNNAIDCTLHNDPDVILSLGTGLQNDYEYEGESHPKATSFLTKLPAFNSKVAFIKMLFTMVKYQVKLNLDAELRWQNWRREIPTKQLASRIFRINPDLGEAPPLLDDVGKVKPLLHKVTGWIHNTAAESDKIGEIACRLVASSFYFRRVGDARKASNSAFFQLSGVIACRIPKDSHNIRQLGKYLDSGHGSAAFVVADRDGEDQRIPIPTQEMVETGQFTDIPLTIAIPDEQVLTKIAIELKGFVDHSQLFDISGFPRELMKHDFASHQL